MLTIIQPVKTRAKRGPYRRHSDEFKRAAAARTQVDGASVSLIARELKINTNQLFSWRKRFGDEALSGGTAPSQLLAVTVLDTLPSPAPYLALSCSAWATPSCAWRARSTRRFTYSN